MISSMITQNLKHGKHSNISSYYNIIIVFLFLLLLLLDKKEK